MTILTLVGKVTDAHGHAEHRDYQWEGPAAVEHRSFTAIPSVEYRSVQPATIPVRRSHGATVDVGRAVHLERTPDDSIIAVAVVDGVDDLLIPRLGPWYWSPELRHRGGHDVEITELAVVTDPATFGLQPLELVPGDTRQAANHVRCRHRPQLAALLDRAYTANRLRGFCAPINIEDRRPLQHIAGDWWVDARGRQIPVAPEHGARIAHDDDGRPIGEVEIRPGRILSVR